MQQIINFIIRFKITLFYFLLLAIALLFTFQTHSYHHSRFFNSASWLSGKVYKTTENLGSYFELEAENRKLLEENKRLRFQLFNRTSPEVAVADSISLDYQVLAARIIKNSYANPDNYITIDKGRDQGIQQDMGVITGQGILGIIEHTSKNYATVLSILNTKSNINAKIKNTNYFGSLVWDKKRYDVVQLQDIPRLVPLMIGDTIVTGAMSSIFPENIPIGTIKKFGLNESKSFYSIDVALFNDMTNLQHVFVIQNMNRPEILQLESEITNDQ